MALRRKNDAKAAIEWYEGYWEIPLDVRKEMDKEREERLKDKDFKIFDETKIDRERCVFHPGLIQSLAGKASRLRQASNLGARFMNRTFATFDEKKNPEAYAQAVAYANNENLFKDPRNCLLFVGTPGTGKTHLAASIANRLVEIGIETRFGTFQSHLDEIRKEFDTSGQKHYLDDIKGVPLLVLDDLGKERKTDWTKSVLYDVINYRYEHMLPTIITTNLSADDIANHCESAVWSRLNEMCDTVVMVGKDNRMR